MAITHDRVVNPGDTGLAADWNADHVVSNDQLPKHSVTFIVAAADSNDTGRADYVCDGTADQVQINQAITDLPANGGCVVLLEGNFKIEATISITKNNVVIMGQGRGTRLYSEGANNIITSDTKDHLKIIRLYIWKGGVGIEFKTTTYSTVENCWLSDQLSSGIYLWSSCEKCKIVNCRVSSVAGAGIQLEDSEYCLITNCYAESNSGPNITVGDCLYCSVLGCVARYGGFYGIGISSEGCVVDSCFAIDNIQDGILLEVASECIVANCVCYGNDRNNTTSFDGIQVVEESNRNIIASNRCYENDRYEINIAAANCNKNLVHGNICIGTDHVGAINDAGTNTTLADNTVA